MSSLPSLENSETNLLWQCYWEEAYISFIERRNIIPGILVSFLALYLQRHFIKYVSVLERKAHVFISLSSWNQVAESQTNYPQCPLPRGTWGKHLEDGIRRDYISALKQESTKKLGEAMLAIASMYLLSA